MPDRPTLKTIRRVAALYDIHGNLPALELVLAEVAASDVDLIVIGGGPRGVRVAMSWIPAPADMIAAFEKAIRHQQRTK